MPRARRQRRVHWAAYLWPGLPHLWINGSVAGLLLALAFSVLLNVMILTTVVWPEWFETRFKLGCGTVVALLWLLALWETRCELRRLAEKAEATLSESPEEEPTHPNDQLLREAQQHYLACQWFEAEKALNRAIANNKRDIEARLWQAMLLRRTDRTDQALRKLNQLQRLDDATAWAYEIEQEKSQCLATIEPLANAPEEIEIPPEENSQEATLEFLSSVEQTSESDPNEQTNYRAA